MRHFLLIAATLLLGACSAGSKPTQAVSMGLGAGARPIGPVPVPPTATAKATSDPLSTPREAAKPPDTETESQEEVIDAILASAPTRDSGAAASNAPSEEDPGPLAMDVVQQDPKELWRFRIQWKEGRNRHNDGSFHLLVNNSYSVPVLSLRGGRKWRKVQDENGNDLDALLAGANARCTFFDCVVTESLDVQLEDERMRAMLANGLPLTLESDGGARKSVSLPPLVGPQRQDKDEIVPEAVVEPPRMSPSGPEVPPS